MIEINRHRFYLVQILKDIYSDLELGNILGFKGGTALMFFYGLPRFSIDLVFNLLNKEKEGFVFNELRKILNKYGKIHDEAIKYFGPLIVLDYGIDERKLKLEISNRAFNDSYEIKDLLGISVKVMVKQDMFAHKLCALLDRDEMANRDLFDCWFFMQNQTPVNIEIVELRTGVTFSDYLDSCINKIMSISDKGLLQGIGELLDNKMKTFVRNKMHRELLTLLRFYREYPIT